MNVNKVPSLTFKWGNIDANATGKFAIATLAIVLLAIVLVSSGWVA